MGSGSNLGNNLNNHIVPDLDDVTEIENRRAKLPKQLEDRCKWLEERFRKWKELTSSAESTPNN